MSLNELTTRLTAFSSWYDFATAMNNGYCPTLRKQTGRSKSIRQHNEQVEELAYRIEELGWPVFRG